MLRRRLYLRVAWFVVAFAFGLAAVLTGCQKDADKIADQLIAEEKQTATAAAQKVAPTQTAAALQADIKQIEAADGFVRIKKIETFFDDVSKTTHYAAIVVTDARLPKDQLIEFKWSGPNCGSYGAETIDNFEKGTNYLTRTPGPTPSTEKLPRVQGSVSTEGYYRWTHPHPPCGATTTHKEVTVTLQVTDGNKTHSCQYQGADAGEILCK